MSSRFVFTTHVWGFSLDVGSFCVRRPLARFRITNRRMRLKPWQCQDGRFWGFYKTCLYPQTPSPRRGTTVYQEIGIAQFLIERPARRLSGGEEVRINVSSAQLKS